MKLDIYYNKQMYFLSIIMWLFFYIGFVTLSYELEVKEVETANSELSIQKFKPLEEAKTLTVYGIEIQKKGPISELYEDKNILIKISPSRKMADIILIPMKKRNLSEVLPSLLKTHKIVGVMRDPYLVLITKKMNKEVVPIYEQALFAIFSSRNSLYAPTSQLKQLYSGVVVGYLASNNIKFKEEDLSKDFKIENSIILLNQKRKVNFIYLFFVSFLGMVCLYPILFVNNTIFEGYSDASSSTFFERFSVDIFITVFAVAIVIWISPISFF